MGLVAIKPVTGGTFVADVGDDDARGEDLIAMTEGMIDEGYPIRGYWRADYTPRREPQYRAIKFTRQHVAWIGDA